MMHLNY